MDAFEKTKSVGRQFIHVSKLSPNPNNPNTMDERTFNLLADNIEATGITDPILVRPLSGDSYRIIGGHHRFEVAKVLGFEEVPCTIITDPEFDEDKENFQVLRMNMIRGKLSPDKFLKMYQSMSVKYEDEILAESFGFADEEEFKKLVKSVSDSLPKDVKKEFDKAAKEVKTIEDLSKILNSLFTNYGKSLPVGLMILDFGGKESVWLRLSNETKKAVFKIGDLCLKEKRTVDDIIGGFLRQVASGKHSDDLMQLIAESKEVEIPDGITLPIEEVLNPSTGE